MPERTPRTSGQEPEWTTAQVAVRLGLPVSTVRWWAREGLIRPVRTVRHTYVFGPEVIDRVEYIVSRRRQGVGLAQIRRELASFSWGSSGQGHLAHEEQCKDENQGQLVGPNQSPGQLQGQEHGQDPFTVQRRPTYVVFANQKGGVGKTTCATNVGAALAAAGQHVLVIDWDPQANASQALGLSPTDVEEGLSIFDCVNRDDLPLSAIIRPTSLPHLNLAPANIQLSGLELDLAHRLGREFTLRTICRQLEDPHQELQPHYDWVIIDTPPTLGLIAINALVAANIVMIPVQAEYLSLEGVRQLVNTIYVVRQRLNPTLTLGGVIITMFDSREPLADSIRSRIYEVFGEQVPVATVPRSTQVVAAQARGVPLQQLFADDPAAQAYRDVAQLLLTLRQTAPTQPTT